MIQATRWLKVFPNKLPTARLTMTKIPLFQFFSPIEIKTIPTSESHQINADKCINPLD
jgi:hypothetical protein